MTNSDYTQQPPDATLTVLDDGLAALRDALVAAGMTYASARCEETFARAMDATQRVTDTQGLRGADLSAFLSHIKFASAIGIDTAQTLNSRAVTEWRTATTDAEIVSHGGAIARADCGRGRCTPRPGRALRQPAVGRVASGDGTAAAESAADGAHLRRPLAHRGEANGRMILSPQQVRAIKKLVERGEEQEALSDLLAMSPSTIAQAVSARKCGWTPKP